MGQPPSQLLRRDLGAEVKRGQTFRGTGTQRAGRPTLLSLPLREKSQAAAVGADMAVLGSGGSYTVGGGTSRPRRPEDPVHRRGSSPAGPPGAQSAGARGGELRQHGWKGGSGEWEAAGSPERRAPRAASSAPLTGLAGTGERQSINKPRRERAPGDSRSPGRPAAIADLGLRRPHGR